MEFAAWDSQWYSSMITQYYNCDESIRLIVAACIIAQSIDNLAEAIKGKERIEVVIPDIVDLKIKEKK